MATKIRLARGGRKRKPIYNVVVADSRAPRDGKFIEKLGTFNPNVEPPIININVDSAFDWVMKGAEITDTARKLLSTEGVMYRKHLQVGVNKGAVKQEDADAKYQAWVDAKNKATADQVAASSKAAEDAAKKAVADRAKIREEAAAAAKKEAEEAIKAAEEAEAAAKAEAEAEEAPGAEEAPAEEAAPEAVAEEAPAEEAKDAE